MVTCFLHCSIITIWYLDQSFRTTSNGFCRFLVLDSEERFWWSGPNFSHQRVSFFASSHHLLPSRLQLKEMCTGTQNDSYLRFFGKETLLGVDNLVSLSAFWWFYKHATSDFQSDNVQRFDIWKWASNLILMWDTGSVLQAIVWHSWKMWHKHTGSFRKNDKSKMFVKILIFTKIKFSQLF